MKRETKSPQFGRSVPQAAMSPSELKSALWDAANTLRGSAVDRTDWKGYILPLLFFKRISDVWDEETAEAQEMYGEADPSLFPEIHRFVVPEGCHWNDVRNVATNVGTALRRAMQEIERANPDTLVWMPPHLQEPFRAHMAYTDLRSCIRPVDAIAHRKDRWP